MNWIKPPWRDDGYEGWPYVGDPFLAAIEVQNRHKPGKFYWEYHLLSWSETGLETGDGDSWSAWGESDIEWIARIPAPVSG